jgi:integrase
MLKTLNRLTDKAIRSALTVKSDRDRQLNDGGGLYLRIRNGRGLWLHYSERAGRRACRVLGSLDTTSLKAAREARAKLALGLEHESARAGMRFDKAAADFFASKRIAALTSTDDNRAAVAYYCDKLSSVAVDAIRPEDVAAVLMAPRKSDPNRPLWSGHGSGTGENLRNVIERILDKAGIEKHKNPARWRHCLDDLLDEHGSTGADSSDGKAHHASMPYADVPAFLRKLDGSQCAQFLRLLILTATRFSELWGARWTEFQLGGDAPTWTVPAERMKAGKEHIIPLAPQVVAILRLLVNDGEFVFPGKSAAILARSKVERYYSSIAPGYTFHGFRSSAAVWMQHAGYDGVLIDRCLAHSVGGSVSQAYQRSTQVEQRRGIMRAWADYAVGAES